MERRAIRVHGIVQGVGFRPFVYGLATEMGLAGFVRNNAEGVFIEVEGDRRRLDRFTHDLGHKAPSLARIDELVCDAKPFQGDRGFYIEESDTAAAGAVLVSPDVATCAACLREMFDPADRRYRYPFLNCTDCGPRLTIIRGAPYDRERSTMAGFRMCPACRVEYENPADRRFHAQPTACADCGPSVQLTDSRGQLIAADDPIGEFTRALRRGAIGALKGLGGYHLACDAGNEAAVAELRRRKHREEKPFALMVASVEAARALCDVSSDEEKLLTSSARPIVLLRRRLGTLPAPAIAPGNPNLGIMLPYTPLHHLLMDAVAGTPLVMTSGNRSDEPIAYEDTEALARLGDIADLFLVHNRPIHVRCDDSVTRIVAGAELPLRRSRGYAPRPVSLPFDCGLPMLAVGGQLKGVFALGRGRHAILSHHLGDLDHLAAWRAFEGDVALYEELFVVRPALLAHDLHPDYASTGYALRRAARESLPTLGVQHHEAHVASVMAENGIDTPVIGVAFDGTGFGPDGAIWGGEFFVGDYRGFRRAAHLRYVPMPGGDQAIRQPWRMALAHLVDADIWSHPLPDSVPSRAGEVVRRMIERRFNAPATSSMGRLFDAVASLAGIRHEVRYEGQAAIELEWLATDAPPSGSYPLGVEVDPNAVGERTIEVDTRPLIGAVAADVARKAAPAVIARRFQSSVVDLIESVCTTLREQTGISRVAISGGGFMNALLTSESIRALESARFEVLRHRLVPPNDGGISLGQLAIAAARHFRGQVST